MTNRLAMRYLIILGSLFPIGMAAGHGTDRSARDEAIPGTWDAAIQPAMFDVTPQQDADSPPVVIRSADTSASLADRVNWAKAEAGRRGFGTGYWVGYSIVKEMGERSFIGSFYSEKRRNRPSLGELITGVQVESLPSMSDDSFGSMSGTMNFDDDENGKPRKLVRKEVGLLFHVTDPGNMRSGEVGEMTVSNLSLRVDLDGDPLIWVGGAEYEESVTFLEGAFRKTADLEARKDLIVAIGLHDESTKAIGLLRDVLTGNGDPELREDAAFWLGQTQTPEAQDILNEVAWKDASEDVREKCIFSLSQMEDAKSVDLLIALAKGHSDDETRKQATFWLGQKASEKAVGALKELAYTDEDTEVQRSAMYALAQVDDGGGVDELIKIARTHPNPKIRKDAIFWLGQCEDPRALDVLVDIVKGK